MAEELEGDYIPAEEQEEYDEEEDQDTSSESLLDVTHKLRKRIVRDITKRGMPQDKDERVVLLQAMRDMDQTSVNRLKLDVERDGVENDRAAQDIVERLYRVNPHGLRAQPGDEAPRRIEFDESQIPSKSFDDDEKHIGLVKETSEEFLERMDDEK